MEGNLPNLPVIPLASADGLPATLDGFMASFIKSRDTPQWPIDTARDLLPHCMLNGPMTTQSTESIRNVVLCFQDLLRGIVVESGQSEIGAMVRQDEAARLASFWAQEYALP
jgi:hypothetical protein